MTFAEFQRQEKQRIDVLKKEAREDKIEELKFDNALNKKILDLTAKELESHLKKKMAKKLAEKQNNDSTKF